MARIKMHIPKEKLPFYPLCEVKCRLQNGVSTQASRGRPCQEERRVCLERGREVG